ncbi:hypothetical protein FM042_03385 [Aliidiomarina halalkaliphila]|uniref:DUF304 domain-containing protein n=1 Tax=Aliidiomarina halalkaliphila TaxID=2593535 RepID=A0A552X4F7_9GAMM|nr:hypothetical protein [Aliidiomarina halalkaliphila]TRW49908.1 hypothetical protein FM042_03385 [Aliidiomarina halalkaliphila]
MKKISGSTFYFKKVFPTVWFGFLAIFFVTAVLSGAISESFMFLVVPVFMAVFGFVLFKKLIWDLADEVYDEGESLLFRKGDKEQRVLLKDIINVSYAQMNSPERVVLKVRSGGQIGQELIFNPPMSFNPFSKNPIIVELLERIDRARST